MPVLRVETVRPNGEWADVFPVSGSQQTFAIVGRRHQRVIALLDDYDAPDWLRDDDYRFYSTRHEEST